MIRYKVGSLFAGIGGICQAFKDSGCDVKWANEIDTKACITYKLNHKNVKLIEGDIKQLSIKGLNDIDILTAGFPCQPFSMAGNGKGFDDIRGQLFFEVVKVLKELKPKAYFLENVKNLATHNNRETFKVIREKLKDAEYSFIPFILNASDYVEIPQGRERIYIVGFRNEENYFFEKPIEENINNSVKSIFSRAFTIPRRSNKLRKEVKDFLDPKTVKEGDIYNDKNNKIHIKVIEAVRNGSTVYQYRRHYVRENKSNLCPTLTANMGEGGHNVPIILDGEFPRRLTPKECFNLQGFPNDFKLPTNLARSHLYKQAGNSVVVPIVQKIAKEMVRVLSENRNS